MKIPFKYGSLTALGLIIWVLLAHLLVANPQSLVHTLFGPIFFNILHFTMIFLGVKALERERGDKLRFKDALKTGVSIAFVFALIGSLFFGCLVFFVGTEWLPAEPGAAPTPANVLLIKAFAGFFLGTIVLGLIYSTVIAFFVAKRQSEG